MKVKRPIQQPQRQKKQTTRFPFLRIIFRAGLVLILVGVLFSSWDLLKNPNFLPVRQVKLEATYQHINQKTLAMVVAPYVTNVSLFSLNADQLKKNILEQPWIYNVWIKRIWPDQIEIQVAEQKAVAVWNTNSLLNFNGEIFAAPQNTFPANLPILNGPEGTQELVWQQWQQFTAGLAPLNLVITELDLNSRGSWQLILNNGIKVVLGRSDIGSRFNRFVAVYPKVLASKADSIAGIDLRYVDGFAVMPRPNLQHK